MRRLNKFTLKTLFEKYDKIEIPKIQRDYAFGRLEDDVNEKREKFIGILVDYIVNKKALHLDFVYGILNQGTFIPLDGQQRITTLWLIELYLMKKTNEVNINRLDKFTYETRVSSKEFGKKLIEEWILPEDNNIESSIHNSNWFFNAWKYDPTISSMITVLEEIHKKFKDIKEENLNTNNITFSFLEVSKLGKPEELYIKMNSRGKELSRWEIFKSELFKKIPEILMEDESNIKNWFDNKFLEFFWNLKKNDGILDKFDFSMHHLFKIIMYVKLIEKENFSKDDIRSKFKFDRKTNNEDILEFLKANENKLVDKELIENVKKFVDFIILYRETIKEESFSRFGNEKGLLLGELFKILKRESEVQPADVALFYAYYKYIEINKTLNLDELKQVIRIVSNLDESYRKQVNILVPFIRGLNKAISNEAGIIKYFVKVDIKDLSFGALSFEQAYEEKIKATEINKNDDKKLIESIYLAESNKYLDGTIGFLLRMTENGHASLNKVYEQFIKVFTNEEQEFFVSKEQVIKMTHYIKLEDIMLSNAIPRNVGVDEYAANKDRDYAWRKLFIKYGYNSADAKKDIQWLYDFLFDETYSRNVNDFSNIEKWYYYHSDKGKLIEEIGAMKEEDKRVYGLNWNRTGFNAQKYDVPLVLFRNYFREKSQYEGIRTLNDNERASYYQGKNKIIYVGYDYLNNSLDFYFRRNKIADLKINIETFENDVKNKLEEITNNF